MEVIHEQIGNKLSSYLEDAGITSPVVRFEKNDSNIHGDVSTNVALMYSKELGKNPKAFAEELVSFLQKEKIQSIKKIEIAGPGFINIFFDSSFFLAITHEVLSRQETYGINKDFVGQVWVIEHTSPNPNKAMHLGHLRNNLVGMSLIEVLKAGGATVRSDMVDNNRGIAIAKLMFGFLLLMRKSDSTPATLDAWIQNPESWKTPEDANLAPDVFVTECYIAGEKETKENLESDAVVRQMVVSWESHDENTWKLWEHVLGYSYEGIKKTLNRLQSVHEKIWHEHEHYHDGKQFVEEGIKKGIFVKLEDGAVLTKLESYNIPDTILLKRDGTSLYITQDIALTDLKKKFYHADKLVWVVGPEQSLAMKQLFAICEQLGIGKLSDFTHVPYGYVSLKGDDGSYKKMSSRDGNVVLIDDLLDTAREAIHTQFLEHGRPDSAETSALSEKLALGAVKFALLKPERSQDISFDIKQSVETKGDSGVYVLYTYARIQSILRKAKERKITIESQAIDSGLEVSKLFMFYPEVVKRAQKDLSAHLVAQYLLELTSAFNAWYGKEVILDGGETEGHKLAVAEATSIIIRNGLSILGISTLDEI